jgi:hypothetical protein
VSLDKITNKHGQRTLFIAVGTQSISSGVMTGKLSSALWLKESYFDTKIDADHVGESSLEQLNTTLYRLAEIQDYQGVDQIRVLIADSWLVMTDLPWRSNSKSARDAERDAHTRLVTNGFDIDSADTLRLDDAPFGTPRLTVVYPSTVLDALNQLSNKLKARLASVLPLSVAAWNLQSGYKSGNSSQNTQPQVQVILDKGLLVFSRSLALDRKRLSELSMRTDLDVHAPMNQQIRAAWLRLSMRDSRMSQVVSVNLLDLTQSEELKVNGDAFFVLNQHLPKNNTNISPRLGLAAHASGLRSILDAVPIKATWQIWHWGILATAALFAVVMMVRLLETNFTVQSLKTSQNMALKAIQQKPPSKSLSREELAKVQSINAAIQVLNLPLPIILRALEPPRDIKVALLSVETSNTGSLSQKSNLKIVAEARNSLDMAQYVAFVSARKPFINAYLTQHEIDVNSADRPYRFTLEALWHE